MSQIGWPYKKHWFILCSLFNWCMCLSLVQHHTVLITEALQYSLQAVSVIPPALFCLKAFLAICFFVCFFLCFHTNFRVSCSVRNAVGILIGIALKDSTHTKILSQYHWITWLQNPQQISGSQIQQYITYTMTKWGLYQGCKDSLISRSSSVWHITLTNWRIKTIWPCQWKQKKAFDKIQCLLLIKALNKVAMESAYLNIIEAYVAYPQPTPVVKTNTQWWKVESFSFKIKRRQRFSLVLEVLVTAIGQGKEKESKLERKKYTCHCLQMAWYYR